MYCQESRCPVAFHHASIARRLCFTILPARSSKPVRGNPSPHLDLCESYGSHSIGSHTKIWTLVMLHIYKHLLRQWPSSCCTTCISAVVPQSLPRQETRSFFNLSDAWANVAASIPPNDGSDNAAAKLAAKGKHIQAKRPRHSAILPGLVPSTTPKIRAIMGCTLHHHADAAHELCRGSNRPGACCTTPCPSVKSDPDTPKSSRCVQTTRPVQLHFVRVSSTLCEQGLALTFTFQKTRRAPWSMREMI